MKKARPEGRADLNSMDEAKSYSLPLAAAQIRLLVR